MSGTDERAGAGEIWALGVVDCLQLVGQASALLDGEARVAALNDGARQALGPALDETGEQLRFADEDSRARFEAAFEAILAGRTDAPTEIAVRINAGRSLSMRLRAVPGAIRQAFVNAHVLLIVAPAAEPLPGSTPNGIDAYGLTTGEMRLARKLCAGRSLKDASGLLNISYETARSRLKRIYAKTGTRRQGELIAFLSSRQGLNN